MFVSEHAKGHFKESEWNVNELFNTAANPRRWFTLLESEDRNKKAGHPDWEPPPAALI